MTRGKRRIWSMLTTLAFVGCVGRAAIDAEHAKTVDADTLAAVVAAKVDATITAKIDATVQGLGNYTSQFGVGASVVVVVAIVGAYWLMRSMLKAAICKFTECRKN